MPVIESKIMINTEAFKKNAEDHISLIDEFRLLEKKFQIILLVQNLNSIKEINCFLESV